MYDDFRNNSGGSDSTNNSSGRLRSGNLNSGGSQRIRSGSDNGRIRSSGSSRRSSYGGNRSAGGKRIKPRYDRLAAAGLIFILIIFFFASCAKGCSKSNNSSNNNQPATAPSGSTKPSGENPQNTSDPNGGDPHVTPATVTEYGTATFDFTKIYQGDLILVNEQHPYNFDYATGDTNIVPIYKNRNDSYSVKDYETYLDLNVIAQLNALMADCSAAISYNEFRVVSGWYDKGKADDFPDYYAGRSFSISTIIGKESNRYKPEGKYAWFNDHCAEYGFILRYPANKEVLTGKDGRAYTFRYVGVPHASYMKENDLSLEEYIDKLKAYTNLNPLKITANDSVYEVYYVQASAGSVTEAPVPTNKTYSSSGNNIDGFIITVLP